MDTYRMHYNNNQTNEDTTIVNGFSMIRNLTSNYTTSLVTDSHFVMCGVYLKPR